MIKKRKFNGKIFTEGTTWSKNKKALAVEDALKIRRRGMKARIIPIKIGYAVYYK